MSEHKFPTIKDAAEVLAGLVEQGFGGLAIQIIIAPDSTIQAIAKTSGNADGKPAIMLDFAGQDGRMPVSMINPDRMTGGSRIMPSMRSN